jgi:hypothetical protein
VCPDLCVTHGRRFTAMRRISDINPSRRSTSGARWSSSHGKHPTTHRSRTSVQTGELRSETTSIRFWCITMSGIRISCTDTHRPSRAGQPSIRRTASATATWCSSPTYVIVSAIGRALTSIVAV